MGTGASGVPHYTHDHRAGCDEEEKPWCLHTFNVGQGTLDGNPGWPEVGFLLVIAECGKGKRQEQGSLRSSAKV